jgi:Integrase core domain
MATPEWQQQPAHGDLDLEGQRRDGGGWVMVRMELLNGEIFYTLREAQIIIESWRHHYNTVRPH